VNVVDSSGWIEFALDGPNAGIFETPLLDTANLVVPSISVFEVYRFVLRERGREAALTLAASMRQGTVVDLDAALAVEAAELAQAHRLPMADAIIYSVARVHEATLWTQDADLRGLDGVKYVAAKG
jgi:predicted nucleic acid-binding protein